MEILLVKYVTNLKDHLEDEKPCHILRPNEMNVFSITFSFERFLFIAPKLKHKPNETRQYVRIRRTQLTSLRFNTGSLPRPRVAAFRVPTSHTPCSPTAAAGLQGDGYRADRGPGLQPSCPHECRIRGVQKVRRL